MSSYKQKINQSASAKLKQKQYLQVHDNLIKSIHQYIKCDKSKPNVEAAFRAKLVNQANITQYFLEAFNSQMNPEEQALIDSHKPSLLNEVNQITSRNDFLNQVVQGYKSTLLTNKRKMIEYTADLKKQGTKKQQEGYLLSIVEGVAKQREKQSKILKNYEQDIKNNKQIKVQRKFNPIVNFSLAKRKLPPPKTQKIAKSLLTTKNINKKLQPVTKQSVQIKKYVIGKNNIKK